MLDLLADPNAWISLATITLLEIVLGIDNVIFISIVSSRLPPERQPLARRLGLMVALGVRILLLLAITWIIGLTQPVFSLFGLDISWRDLILIVGGLFLLAKAVTEIHAMVEGEVHETGPRQSASFAGVIAQIVALDVVFSLDSVLTAVGMAQHVEVMIAAVVIAMVVMLVAAEPLSAFVNRHATVKMLALAFLLLIGVTLVADGAHFHIPRGYLYFAVVFAVLVEAMNMLVRRRAARRRAAKAAD